MRQSIIIISLVLVFLTSAFAQKEVVIIGTMHGVPKLTKNAYRPMLKKAKDYQPEAIFVERPQASDSVSFRNYFPEMAARIDSIREVSDVDMEAVKEAQKKSLSEMQVADFKLLNSYHYQNYDYANAEYYSYLAKFGLEGSKKPGRNENKDLTAKLGIAMGLTEIHSMDNQWYYEEYAKGWSACSKADRVDKDKGRKRITRQLIGSTFKGVFSALFGRLGAYVNAKKTTELYHKANSFRYREISCEACEEGTKYWDLRNQGMARNIGNQIRSNDNTRNVVVVGAGHLVGLQEVLEREFPDIKVRLYREL